MRDFTAIKEACDKARELARTSPGPYGGRYVAEQYNRKTKQQDIIVLDSDDPELYRKRTTLDIFAHVTPEKVFPIGRARYWLNDDGTEYNDDDLPTGI